MAISAHFDDASYSAGQATVNYPTNLSAGDLIVLFAASSNQSLAVPGFTLIDWFPSENPVDPYAFYRVADGSETGTIAIGGDANRGLSVRITGFDAASPIGASSAVHLTSVSPFTLGPITTDTNGAMVLGIVDTITLPPTEVSLDMDDVRIIDVGDTMNHLMIGAQIQASAGTTGTIGGTTYNGAPTRTVLISINAEGGGGGDDPAPRSATAITAGTIGVGL